MRDLVAKGRGKFLYVNTGQGCFAGASLGWSFFGDPPEVKMLSGWLYRDFSRPGFWHSRKQPERRKDYNLVNKGVDLLQIP